MSWFRAFQVKHPTQYLILVTLLVTLAGMAIWEVSMRIISETRFETIPWTLVIGAIIFILVILLGLMYAGKGRVHGPVHFIIQPDRPRNRFMDGRLWQNYEDLLWKVDVSTRPGHLTVTNVNGPFCAKCRTGLISRGRGGLFGTDVLAEEYWACPQSGCGTRLKIRRDEEDQKDEVEKIVQGRIDNGTLDQGRIEWG